jgi:hypothetical protein
MCDPLVWTCAVCDLPIADGTGYLTVDLKEAKRVVQWRAEWERDLRSRDFAMKELATCPQPTRWLVLHAACDPVSKPGPYDMAVEKLRTPWELLAMTERLMGNRWLEGTNWRRLISRVAEERGFVSSESLGMKPSNEHHHDGDDAEQR